MEFLRFASDIGTPIALIAFVAGLIAAVLNQRAAQATQRLEGLEGEDRVRAMQPWLAKLGIDGDNLTRDQKFLLIQEGLRQRGRRAGLIAMVAIVLAVCATAAVVFGPDDEIESYVPRLSAPETVNLDGAGAPDLTPTGKVSAKVNYSVAAVAPEHQLLVELAREESFASARSFDVEGTDGDIALAYEPGPAWVRAVVVDRRTGAVMRASKVHLIHCPEN